MQKGLSTIWVILIILFVVILISGGVFFYFKKTSKVNNSSNQAQNQNVSTNSSANSSAIDTSNWQTGNFENITFKYPTTWNLEKSPETDTDVIYLKSDKFVKDNTGSNGPDNPIEISFEISNPQKTNLNEAVAALSGTGEGFLIGNEKPQKIDTVDGLRCTLTLVNQSKDDAVFFIYKNKLYKIMVSSFSILSDKDNSDFQPYFDAVLSTIKLN